MFSVPVQMSLRGLLMLHQQISLTELGRTSTVAPTSPVPASPHTKRPHKNPLAPHGSRVNGSGHLSPMSVQGGRRCEA